MATPSYLSAAGDQAFSSGAGAASSVGGGFNPMMGLSGLNNMFAGATRQNEQPYYDAMEQYKKYFDQAAGYQMPFYNAGTQSLDPYQQRLKQMSDPQDYYNSIMGGYNASPYSQVQQQNSLNQSTNAASASGMSGSTPMQMQMQQNAADISTQDMDKYYSNVNSINQDYMSGLNKLISGGQMSANELTQLTQQMMKMMGRAQFGETMGQNKDTNSMLGGIEQMGMSVAGLF